MKPRQVERDRARDEADHRTTVIAARNYAAGRTAALEALLRDPASWRWMAVHFRQVREAIGDTDEEWWLAVNRLHQGAVDVLRLLGEPLPPEAASE